MIKAGLVTEGRGTTDDLEVYEHTIADPSVEGSVDFEFVIPLDAPCTYDGQLIRVKWRVEARLDLPWASDERMDVPIAVVAS